MLKKNKELLINLILLILSITVTLPIIIADILMMFGVNNLFVHIFMNPLYGVIVCSIISFGIGKNYFVKTYYEWFRWKTIGMNTLVSITVTISFIWSLYIFIDNSIMHGFLNTISIDDHINSQFTYFFEIPCSLITILKIGEWINMFLKNKLNRDSEAIKNLASTQFNYYDMKNKTIILKDINELKINDYVYIKENEKIPADGILYSKKCNIDESFITGEVSSIFKKRGEQIFSGSVNLGEAFIIQSNTEKKDILVNKVVRKLKMIQSSKTNIQKTIDKISFWFTPTILILGILCFIVMLFWGYDIQNAMGLNNSSLIPNFQKWETYNISQNVDSIIKDNIKCSFYFMISLIVISCPCALGIAAPLGVIIGTSKATKIGIVFNNNEVFDMNKRIDVIALDKTGTLTEGKLSVAKEIGDRKDLNMLYNMEFTLNHPISQSIISYLKSRYHFNHQKVDVKHISNNTFLSTKDKNEYIITSINTKAYKNSKKDKKLEQEYKKTISNINIKTSFVFIKNNKVINYFILEDKIRSEAKQFIKTLMKNKIEPVLITGDTQENTDFLVKELGIKNFYTNKNPFEKEKIISRLQSDGKTVAYVGDGINDLIALKQSDLSFNISTNISVTDSVSDITLLDNNLMNIWKAILLIKYTRNIIKWNLIWSFSYNGIVLPIAFIGIVPTLLSMIAMLFSDIVVSVNSIASSYKDPFKKNRN